MQELLFEIDITMPHSDFTLFDICNRAPKHWGSKQQFYALKEKLLKRFGVLTGYDLQVIEKTCWSCDGTGMYNACQICHSCLDGIYSTRKVTLERWVLNGKVFHIPTDFNGRVSHGKLIDGLITHTPDDLNPNYAFACLLYKYDKEGWNEWLRVFSKNLTPAEWKKWGELSKQSTNIFYQLAVWYDVLPDNDDLPF